MKPTVNMKLKNQINKKETSDIEKWAITIQHMAEQRDKIEIFTDGSKMMMGEWAEPSL